MSLIKADFYYLNQNYYIKWTMSNQLIYPLFVQNLNQKITKNSISIIRKKSKNLM